MLSEKGLVTPHGPERHAVTILSRKKDVIKDIHRLGHHITLGPLFCDCHVNDFCNLIYICVVARKSMDRVYTAFRLLESMGELFAHSQRTGFIQCFTS